MSLRENCGDDHGELATLSCRDGDQELSRTELKDEMIRLANVDLAFQILDTNK